MKNILNKNNGITMIALVITVIILLILAIVAIATLRGDNLFEKAEFAKAKYEEAEVNEKEQIDALSDEIDARTGNGGNTNGTNNNRNGLGTLLLPETTITKGGEYELSDSIENYSCLKIFAGVTTSANKVDVVWGSVEFPTANIVCYNANNIERTFLVVWVGSNTSHYRVPHIRFNSETKIFISEIPGAGWSTAPADGYKLIIYGY